MDPIKVAEVTKSFGDIQALKNVSFSVKPGEVLGFLGPNGAGKSTTIRCILDFIRPDTGHITFLGQNANEESHATKHRVGYLPGEVSYYNNWTVGEHVSYLQKIKGLNSGAEIYARELAELFSLDFSRNVKDLSTGNKQKLGLVLAFMHRPEVLILDEPTNGLDPLLQQKFYDLVRQHSASGATILISSHNLAEVERLCDRVAIIRKGEIIETATIKELRDKKIYAATVYFDQKFEGKDLAKFINEKHITLNEQLENGLSITIKGDIDYLIKALNGYKIKDLEIQHANLEAVFLEYYK